MSDISTYSSRYSYYWNEDKKMLLGFLILPLLSCLLIYFVDGYSVQILGQKLSSVFPITWLFVIMGLGGIVIYNHLVCAIHPENLFNNKPDF